MTIKVSIVEDKDEYRQRLTSLVGGAGGLECVGAHRTAEDAMKLIPREKPDVVLLDLELPKMSGLDLLPRLKARLPDMEVIVLTIYKDPQRLFAALESGASGYLVKPAPPQRILEAIAEVRAGGSPMSSQIARLVVQVFQKRGRSRGDLERLTDREQEVLELVARGLQTREIAEELKISLRTVAAHIYQIYEKLHVHSRAAATAKFLQSGK